MKRKKGGLLQFLLFSLLLAVLLSVVNYVWVLEIPVLWTLAPLWLPLAAGVQFIVFAILYTAIS